MKPATFHDWVRDADGTWTSPQYPGAAVWLEITPRLWMCRLDFGVPGGKSFRYPFPNMRAAMKAVVDYRSSP